MGTTVTVYRKVDERTNVTVAIAEDTVEKALQKAGVFLNWPKKCGRCGSDRIGLRNTHIKAKKGKNAGKAFDYPNFFCQDCRAMVQMGKHIDMPDTFFMREGWVDPYQFDQDPSRQVEDQSDVPDGASTSDYGDHPQKNGVPSAMNQGSLNYLAKFGNAEYQKKAAACLTRIYKLKKQVSDQDFVDALGLCGFVKLDEISRVDDLVEFGKLLVQNVSQKGGAHG